MRQVSCYYVYVYGLQQLLLITLAFGQYQQQHVAPGVNPQQYQRYNQQQPNQQQPYQQQPQQQQQQQHYQAPQHQQQQIPQQQQQQQQQQYHTPPQQHQQQQHTTGGHQHGGHGAHSPNVLGGNVQEEKEHIAEHFDVPIDTSKMSEQELQFHYFKMHDSDNNNKLDGCELIKSLIHWHEQGSKETQQQQQPGQQAVQEKIFTDEELISLIDPILKIDDSSRDGFIDYPEFVQAQEKAAASRPQQQQQPQQQSP